MRGKKLRKKGERKLMKKGENGREIGEKRGFKEIKSILQNREWGKITRILGNTRNMNREYELTTHTFPTYFCQLFNQSLHTYRG